MFTLSMLTTCSPFMPVLSTPGGGILPIMAYTRSSVRKGIFFRLQVYERVGILLVEVYERVGKSVIWVCETVQRANR